MFDDDDDSGDGVAVCHFVFSQNECRSLHKNIRRVRFELRIESKGEIPNRRERNSLDASEIRAQASTMFIIF